MGNIGSIQSFRIDRAYGVVRPVTPAAKVSRVEGDGPASSSESSGRIARLISARVPGGISFDDTGSASPTSGALPLYRHPADRNAAAVSIELGRAIDVQG